MLGVTVGRKGVRITFQSLLQLGSVGLSGFLIMWNRSQHLSPALLIGFREPLRKPLAVRVVYIKNRHRFVLFCSHLPGDDSLKRIGGTRSKKEIFLLISR